MFVVLESGDENVNGTSKSDVLLFAAVPNVLYANTSEPIANPKFILAAEDEVAPVPPLVIAIAVPLHVPEVIVPTVAISVPTNLLAAILPAKDHWLLEPLF